MWTFEMMRHGRILKNIVKKDSNGKNIFYKLIESIGNYNVTIYTISVATDEDVSFVEDVGAHAFSIFDKICRSGVRPEFFFDVIEEMIWKGACGGFNNWL